MLIKINIISQFISSLFFLRILWLENKLLFYLTFLLFIRNTLCIQTQNRILFFDLLQIELNRTGQNYRVSHKKCVLSLQNIVVWCFRKCFIVFTNFINGRALDETFFCKMSFEPSKLGLIFENVLGPISDYINCFFTHETSFYCTKQGCPKYNVQKLGGRL